ncbi:MAG TPA: circadian clock-controlled protein [Clostridiaceae bacterium]
MALKVSISFKETEKDMYNFLLSQLSPSIYIKGLIKKEMPVKVMKNEKKQESDFDLDF